jgi:hypothetical protein
VTADTPASTFDATDHGYRCPATFFAWDLLALTPGGVVTAAAHDLTRWWAVLHCTSGIWVPVGCVASENGDAAVPKLDDYEAWRDLQDVLEARDAEWRAGADVLGEQT